METLGSFNYTPESVGFIQTEIKKYLECDDVLAEYIVVMVRNNKTKADVVGDLSDFMDDAIPFVDWLWNFIRSYMDTKREQPESTSSPTNEGQKKPTSRLILNAVRQAADDTKNAIPNSLSMSLDEKIQMDEESNGSYQKGRRNNNDRNNNNRNGNNRRNSNGNNNNNNGKSKQQQQQSTSPTSSTSPTFKVTFSTDGQSRKRKINNSRDSNADMTDLIDEDFGTADAEDLTPVHQTKKTDKKERCQFWPMCKNESCAYFHPTTQCNLFPKCPYGEKCLYIHPSIPCRFGVACTNANCLFNHPQRPMGMGGSFDIMSGPPCRNGFACANKKTCSFAHPPVACRFGEGCTNGRKCVFGHGKPCMFGITCATPGCTFAHHLTTDGITSPTLPDCRYGKECTNVNCKFQHSERDQTAMDSSVDMLSSTLPSTPPPVDESTITDVTTTEATA